MTIQEWLGQDNQLGIDIWEKKYQHNNETFDEWLDRVSGGNENIRGLITEKKFLFGGRILANRGLSSDGYKVTYSNCYVVTPPDDSIESIFECASKLARTFSYGGGCGIDISKLAPYGAKVNNTAKSTSGAVSFMDLYSSITGLIGQNGRRGALMISLDCHHPDIEQFVDIKNDLNKVTNANISIKFTDDFMEAVVNDTDFELSFTRPETNETISKTVKAREVFKKLSDNNWDMGEPGCLFWDKICNYNLLANTKEFEYAGTNPCAEEPLPAGGSCLLGSINLAEFVKNPFTENAYFDSQDFLTTVHESVIALNEVLDEGLMLHPLKEQQDSVRDWRQIGLGVMGIADMLIKLGIRYGSDTAVDFCDNIGYYMAKQAIMTSSYLARSKGAFPKCNMEEISITDFFMNHISDYDDDHRRRIIDNGLCNSQLLTIAPTGTLSTMLGISGGIEPIFANSYTRTTKSLHGKDVEYKVYAPIVQKYMEVNNIDEEESLPDFFVTAQTLNYKDRIAMQSIWQRHIDASISSTVNLPNSATKEDVFNLYIEAWKSNLKGITVFRDGCSRVAILNTDKPKEDPTTKENKPTTRQLSRGDIIMASDNVVGLKRKLMTGCGSLHCSAFFDEATGELLETYLSKGSTGGCNNFMIGLSRMISLAARAGVSIEDIVDQLESTGACPSYAVRSATKKDTSKGSCCPMAVGRALLDMYKEMQSMISDDVIDETYENKEETATHTGPVCPECGDPLIFEGGCNICKSCGYSKCS